MLYQFLNTITSHPVTIKMNNQFSHFYIIKVMNLEKFYQIPAKYPSFNLINLYFNQFIYLKDKLIFYHNYEL
jgi:hypothetical protein